MVRLLCCTNLPVFEFHVLPHRESWIPNLSDFVSSVGLNIDSQSNHLDDNQTKDQIHSK